MGTNVAAILGGLALLTAACAVDEAPGDGPGSVASDQDAGPPDASPTDNAASVSIGGWVGVWSVGFPPVAGATVSIVDHPEFEPVLTDEEGVYRFPSLPTDIEIIVRVELDGALDSYSRVLELRDVDYEVPFLFLFDRGVTPYFANLASVDYDETKGIVLGGTWRDTDEVLAGATVAFSPSAGETVYHGSGGFPEPTLDSTSEGGLFSVWNVPAGDYEVTAGHDTTTRCYANGPEQMEPIRARSFAGGVTWLQGFVCGD